MTARPPTLSLVVLSYRRFDETSGPCLATLESAYGAAGIQLILVDNASDDGAAQRCARWAAQHPAATYLPQKTNLGFAGGMNAGVAAAQGDWVVLVNSDTLFSAGALESLVRTLSRASEQLAMVGPVTNAAGNGQRLSLPGTPFKKVVQIGASAMLTPTGLLTPTYRTDFFCVAVRRNAWQQLGGLDAAFGLGYYEDFDFSLRLRQAGFEQAIAEDVFVAHVGSASFAAFGTDQKTLMRRNRELLRQRHPQVHFESARSGNAAALEHLFQVAQTSGWTDALRQRAAWRLAALGEDEPRSPFKRWRWRWSQRGLHRRLRQAGVIAKFPTAP